MDSPNTELEDKMWDRVCDMDFQQVVAALNSRLPYLEEDLRDQLWRILIDEWRYQ